MSSMDKALDLFEALDGLDDALIEEGMLPDSTAGIPRRGRKKETVFTRFARSGWGVATISVAVSLVVLMAIVRVGQGDFAPSAGEDAPDAPNMSPGNPEQEMPMGTIGDMAPGETPEPDEEVTRPDESARVPFGTRSTSEEGLQFMSLGDGTCRCTGIRSGSPLDADPSVLDIPTYSPDGDVVAEIDTRAFSTRSGLREVYLPRGLTQLDHKTFPMDAPIYRIHGNILYLGSRENPYMVAVATGDGRPGATSLHPDTRILACHALTYDASFYFSLAWEESIPAYAEEESFTIPSGVRKIGDYALLDVGRPIRYGGNLVGWDVLAAGAAGFARTPEGDPLTVTCLDGQTKTVARVRRVLEMDWSTSAALDYLIFSPYGRTDAMTVSEDFYAWLRDPESAAFMPDQFVVESAFGTACRTLPPEELAGLWLSCLHPPTDAAADFVERFNSDPAEAFAGKTAVVLYVEESALYGHRVTDVQVSEGRIHVVLERLAGDVSDAMGERYVLLSVDDPAGVLQGATVTYEIQDAPQS